VEIDGKKRRIGVGRVEDVEIDGKKRRIGVGR